MRLVRKITAEEENFRMEPVAGAAFGLIRRDPVKPEPEGTIVLMAFRLTGYDPDCDGSLMGRFESLSWDEYGGKIELDANGWDVNSVGLYPTMQIVVTAAELLELVARLRAEAGK